MTELHPLPRIMRRIEIHGVPVDVNVFVDFEDAVKRATEYIEWRFARPIVVSPGRCSPGLKISFTSHTDRDKELLESGLPYVEVTFKSHVGRVYPMDGATIEDIDDSLIQYARMLWLEKIFIERSDYDGQMWLDF